METVYVFTVNGKFEKRKSCGDGTLYDARQVCFDIYEGSDIEEWGELEANYQYEYADIDADEIFDIMTLDMLEATGWSFLKISYDEEKDLFFSITEKPEGTDRIVYFIWFQGTEDDYFNQITLIEEYIRNGYSDPRSNFVVDKFE